MSGQEFTNRCRKKRGSSGRLLLLETATRTVHEHAPREPWVTLGAWSWDTSRTHHIFIKKKVREHKFGSTWYYWPAAGELRVQKKNARIMAYHSSNGRIPISTASCAATSGAFGVHSPALGAVVQYEAPRVWNAAECNATTGTHAVMQT